MLQLDVALLQLAFLIESARLEKPYSAGGEPQMAKGGVNGNNKWKCRMGGQSASDTPRDAVCAHALMHSLCKQDGAAISWVLLSV